MRSKLTLSVAAAAFMLSASPGAAQQRSLPEVLHRALEIHPSVTAAHEASAAAEAGVRAARAAWWPGLSLSGSAIRFQRPMVVAPLHGFDFTRAPDFDEVLVQGRFGATYTLWDGGRRGADIRRAREWEGSSREDVREAEAALLESTAEAYVRLLTARDVIDAQDRHQRALEAERDRVAQVVEQGAAPRLELLRAEAELAQARADAEQARTGESLAVAALARLLDEDPATLAAARLADPGSPIGPVPPMLAESEAGRASPTLAAAEREARALGAEVVMARAAWLPSVSASAGYTLFAGASTSSTGEWQGGLQISYPLFTGGGRSAAVALAGARERAARARVDALREEVALALDAARASEMEARSRVVSLEAALASFNELTRVERLALDEGAGVQSDYLRAEAGLFRARAGLAEARRAVLSARIRWARANGDLDLGWFERMLEGPS